MDGVQQGPLVVQRDILVAQFALDGAERLNHDLLARFDGFILPLAVIAARRDDVAVADIGLRVADEYHGEHVHLLGVKLTQCSHLDFLLIASSLTDIAHGRVGRALLQKQFHQAVQLPVAAIGLGIIDGSDEVAHGGSLDAALDHLPRGHQVAERNDAQVMADGSAQQRCCFLEGRNAGQ